MSVQTGYIPTLCIELLELGCSEKITGYADSQHDGSDRAAKYILGHPKRQQALKKAISDP